MTIYKILKAVSHANAEKSLWIICLSVIIIKMGWWAKFTHTAYWLNVAQWDYHLLWSMLHCLEGEKFEVLFDDQIFIGNLTLSFYQDGFRKYPVSWDNVI